MTLPRIFNMGACRLSGPLSQGIRDGIVGRTTIGRGGPTPGTYSFGEMFQLLDFLDGKQEVAVKHRALCGYRDTYAPGPGVKNFAGADVCLIEPNGVVDIDWNGLKLNRAQVRSFIVDPVKPISREAAKAVTTWYNKGILASNDDVRAQTAKQAIALLPKNIDNRTNIADVLENATTTKRDIGADIAELRSRISIPIGVVAYAYQYLPDGRPMFWPADFQERIKASVTELNSPYVEPWRLVLENGGTPVLKPDLRHYQDEFIPTVSALFADFAWEILQQTKVQA